MSTTRKRLAVLLSGRGSNMAAILDATRDPAYPAEIALVISDHENAGGLETALEADIPAFGFERQDYPTKDAHEKAIIQALLDHDIDLICLAGYMRLLSAEFTSRFPGRLINIHPSLLPLYKGLDTHARALAAGDREHGCTVHYVNAEMDGGEIIAQARVQVHEGDTAETLAARVLVEEHKLYPQVVRKLCS
ncbi:MAG: phosphoribosylglycinamide formyltransferase [Pseudomonadota bacterium]